MPALTRWTTRFIFFYFFFFQWQTLTAEVHAPPDSMPESLVSKIEAVDVRSGRGGLARGQDS